MIRCYSIGNVLAYGIYSNGVGGLCGRNLGGTIIGCYSQGNINGGKSSVSVGGLCGQNHDGKIQDCLAGATASGESMIGGLVGYNDQGGIIHCYSTGRVTGLSLAGGLCGEKITGGRYEDSSNFWDTQSSMISTSAMGIGKTMIPMKTVSTFTSAGWDFVGEAVNGTADVWRMCADGVLYPRLSWEFSRGGDLNCPDGVGMEDLVYLAGRWMASTPETVGAADADGSGKVDLGDFIILSEQWMK
jgi:hypothetical protein